MVQLAIGSLLIGVLLGLLLTWRDSSPLTALILGGLVLDVVAVVVRIRATRLVACIASAGRQRHPRILGRRARKSGIRPGFV